MIIYDCNDTAHFIRDEKVHFVVVDKRKYSIIGVTVSSINVEDISSQTFVISSKAE